MFNLKSHQLKLLVRIDLTYLWGTFLYIISVPATWFVSMTRLMLNSNWSSSITIKFMIDISRIIYYYKSWEFFIFTMVDLNLKTRKSVPESRGTWTQEERPILSSERRATITNPQLFKGNIQGERTNWLRNQDGGLTPGQADRLTVGSSITLTWNC
jgi:hypothetical protein